MFDEVGGVAEESKNVPEIDSCRVLAMGSWQTDGPGLAEFRSLPRPSGEPINYLAKVPVVLPSATVPCLERSLWGLTECRSRPGGFAAGEEEGSLDAGVLGEDGRNHVGLVVL